MKQQKTSAESYLEQQVTERQIDQKLKATLNKINRLEKENSKLKQNLKQLEEEINSKYSTVRTQLQILHYIGVLDDLTSRGTLEQKGVFFSILLNRHPTRARKPFSSINDLVYSRTKANCKLIKKDLENTLKALKALGLKKEIHEVEKDLNKLK